MGTTSRRPHATPSARLIAQRELRRNGDRLLGIGAAISAEIRTQTDRIPAAMSDLAGPRGLRLLLNTAVAVLVLSLPYAATASARGAASAESPLPTLATVATITTDDVARAQTTARGFIVATRSPVTVAAEDVAPIDTVVVEPGDTLSELAQKFQVSIAALAYANSIVNGDRTLHIGERLVVPPGEGALYYVKDGDTVEAVAEKFKVDPAVIMSYNRIYFEPEHFAPGQLIFVRGADLPELKQPSRVVLRAGGGINVPASLPARNGRLAWPVGGRITQYFWWGHTGVDLAAPYGSGIGASDDGVVTATGWVAVGGLRVCVNHSGGFVSCYYHTSSVFVSVGQQVSRGHIIAAIGLTGVTTGPHVHWELKINGVAVDPLSY